MTSYPETKTMSRALTETERATYESEGYLCPIDVLSPKEAAAHRSAFERLEEEWKHRLPRPVGEYMRMNTHVVSDVALETARDTRILDIVESVLGPDLLLWSCEYFIKEAHSSQVVSWHQDLTYWGMDGSDHEATAWLALSPATADSGCMKFVAGSHKKQLVPHNDTFAENNLLSRGQEIAVEVDEDDATLAALKPGQMSLHHGRMFHGSGPNTSDDRRIGFVMRFIRPDTPAIGRDFAMLMRGADRIGNRIILVPPGGGNFAPARLALYEEVRSAQNQVLAGGLANPDEMYNNKARHYG